jgi:hypothetical protein
MAAKGETAPRDEVVKSRFTRYFATPCGNQAFTGAATRPCLQIRETIPENGDSLPASRGLTACVMIATPHESKTDVAGTAFAMQRQEGTFAQRSHNPERR